MWRRSAPVSLVLVFGFLVGRFPGNAGNPSGRQEALAAERIMLLRLMADGKILEINPSARVIFKDLDRYLDRRLDGKHIVEIKLQEHTTGCDQIIPIRYEE